MTLLREAFTSPQEPLPNSSSSEAFSPDRIAAVIQAIPIADVVDEMNRANPHLPQGAAEGIMGGELGRLRMLGPTYLQRFYEEPVAVGQKTGVIPQSYSSVELGPSLAAHLPMKDRDRLPTSMIGIDNQPHIVAAANRTLEAFVKGGLLPEGSYEVVLGDHTTQLQRQDVAHMSLVSQYEAGHKGAVDWLMGHGEVGVNGDVVHAPSEVTEEELSEGIFEMKLTTGERTGIAWSVHGEPIVTPFGRTYEASVVLDNKNSDGKIRHISRPGDTYHGRITLFEHGGKLYMDPWAYVPTEDATEKEVEEVVALRRTLQDIYDGMNPATNGERIWDGNAALGVAPYAAEQGYFTGIMLSTEQDKGISGTLPLAILMRHRAEAAMLSAKGHLTQVGDGKQFANLQEFYQTVGKWLNPASGFDKKFQYSNPLLVLTMTVRSEEQFQQMIQAD